MSDYFIEPDFQVSIHRRKEYGVVRLVGIINSSSIFHILDRMEILVREHYNEIVLELTSPGGELSPLQRFISSLETFRERNIRLITQGYDNVASAAAIMLSAGDVRLATTNCNLVYHFSRIPQAHSVTSRNAKRIASSLDELDQWIVDQIVEHTGWTQDFVRQESDNDQPIHIFKAETFNFIDKVGDYRNQFDLNVARTRSQQELRAVLAEVASVLFGKATATEEHNRAALSFAHGRLPKALKTTPTAHWELPQIYESAIRKAVKIFTDDESHETLLKTAKMLRTALGDAEVPSSPTESAPLSKSAAAGVMKIREFRDLIPESGEISQTEITRHFLALGETGSGKTKSMVEPLLKGLVQFRPMLTGDTIGEYSSLFVVDPKNELYDHLKNMCRTGIVDERKLVRVVVSSEDPAVEHDDTRPLLVNFDNPPGINLDKIGLPENGRNFEKFAAWVVNKAASLDPPNILNGESHGTSDFQREASRELKTLVQLFIESLMWFRRYPRSVIPIWRLNGGKSGSAQLPMADKQLKFFANTISRSRSRSQLADVDQSSSLGGHRSHTANVQLTKKELVLAEVQWTWFKYLQTSSPIDVLRSWNELLFEDDAFSKIQERITKAIEVDATEISSANHKARRSHVDTKKQMMLEIVGGTCDDMVRPVWAPTSVDESHPDAWDSGNEELIMFHMKLDENTIQEYRNDLTNWMKDRCEWWNTRLPDHKTELLGRCVSATRNRHRQRQETGQSKEPDRQEESDIWGLLQLGGEAYKGMLSEMRVDPQAVRHVAEQTILLGLFRLLWDLPELVFHELHYDVPSDATDDTGRPLYMDTFIHGRWRWKAPSGLLWDFGAGQELNGDGIVSFFRSDGNPETETKEFVEDQARLVKEGIEDIWTGRVDQSFETWLSNPTTNVFSVILKEIYPLFAEGRNSPMIGENEPPPPATHGPVKEISKCLDCIKRGIGEDSRRGTHGHVRMYKDVAEIGRLEERLERLRTGSILHTYKGDALSGGVVAAIQRFADPLVASTVLFGMDFNGSDENRTRIDQIIQQPGRIVVFSPSGGNMTDGEEFVVRAAKASFFEKVLLAKDRVNFLDRAGGSRHLVGYVADEFQRFITVGDDHGEQSFIDRCRSYGVSCVFATQALASLRYKLGDVRSAGASLDIVLANIGNKAFFRSTDMEAMRYVEYVVGKEGIGRTRGLPMLEPGACWFVRSNGSISRRRVLLN